MRFLRQAELVRSFTDLMSPSTRPVTVPASLPMLGTQQGQWPSSDAYSAPTFFNNGIESNTGEKETGEKLDLSAPNAACAQVQSDENAAQRVDGCSEVETHDEKHGAEVPVAQNTSQEAGETCAHPSRSDEANDQRATFTSLSRFESLLARDFVDLALVRKSFCKKRFDARRACPAFDLRKAQSVCKRSCYS